MYISGTCTQPDNVGARNFWDNERPQWILNQLDDPELVKRTLRDQFKFYVEHEHSIDVNAPDSLDKLKSLKTPVKPWGQLVARKYLEKLPEFKLYDANGYPLMSFLVCQIYPGPKWCDEQGLMPMQFPNKKSKVFDFVDVVQMLIDVYLSNISEVDDPTAAMRIFLIRRTEQQFLPNSDFAKHGVPPGYISKFSKKALFDEIANRFELELGSGATSNEQNLNWSAAQFRKASSQDLSRCLYCNRQPVDLHHLIERSSAPNLMYDKENVVALCTQAHSMISRNLIGEDLSELYAQARIAWRKADVGKRTQCFDFVMHEIHSLAYDSNS